jgi:hypothetical protein
VTRPIVAKSGSELTPAYLARALDIVYCPVRGVRNLTKLFHCSPSRVHEALLGTAQSVLTLTIGIVLWITKLYQSPNWSTTLAPRVVIDFFMADETSHKVNCYC